MQADENPGSEIVVYLLMFTVLGPIIAGLFVVWCIFQLFVLIAGALTDDTPEA